MRSIIKINNLYKPNFNFGLNLFKSINSFRSFNFSTVDKEFLQKVKGGEKLSMVEFKQLITNIRSNPELMKDTKIEQVFTAHIPSNISEVNSKELNEIMTIFMHTENLPSNELINIIQKRQGELAENEVSQSGTEKSSRDERSPRRNVEERSEETRGSSDAPQGNQIYVSNLPWGARDQDLEETFSKFGEVTVANVVMDRESGKSRGFGFVTFANSTGRDAALQENHEILGRNVFARIANDRKQKREGEEEPRFRDRESSYSQRAPQESRGAYGSESGRTERGEGFNRSSNFDENKTVFIGNLDFGVTEEKIRDEFSDCGGIAKLKLPKHLDGNIKGMCFIEFESERSVEDAVRKSGQNLNGRSVRVTKYTATPPPKKYGDGERSYSSRPAGRDSGRDNYGRDSGRNSGSRDFRSRSGSSEGGNRNYSKRNMRNEDNSD